MGIDNTFLFEVSKKINELIMESYKAGLNYGLEIATIFAEEQGKGELTDEH